MSITDAAREAYTSAEPARVAEFLFFIERAGLGGRA